MYARDILVIFGYPIINCSLDHACHMKFKSMGWRVTHLIRSSWSFVFVIFPILVG